MDTNVFSKLTKKLGVVEILDGQGQAIRSITYDTVTCQIRLETNLKTKREIEEHNLVGEVVIYNQNHI